VAVTAIGQGRSLAGWGGTLQLSNVGNTIEVSLQSQIKSIIYQVINIFDEDT
jgi:hypothetical protein